MITKVYVKPGCISCKTCEAICPKVFQVRGTSQVVSDDFSDEESILKAEAMCPVNVIAVEGENLGVAETKKAKVLSKKMLTHDVVELIFSCDDFSAIPGQFVSLQMKDKLGKFSRSYSISNSTKKGFSLCIKIVPNGRGGNILQSLKENEIIEFFGPSGDFVLQNTENEKVFIATGTGLAPMMTMLKNTPNNVKKTVVFGVRSENDLFYTKELESFENTKVICTLSNPSEDWKGEKGRVTDFLKNISSNAEVYICGAPPMVESVLENLQTQKHPEEKVFHERFVASQAPETKSYFQKIVLDGEIKGLEIIQNLLIAFAIAIPIFWQFSSSQNWLWDLSWYTVTLTMLIRPLSDILSKIGILRRLIVLRKGLGIVSSAIIVTAFLVTAIPKGISFFPEYFSAGKWTLENMAIFGRMSEITAFILLATSNTYSQIVLGKWWKRVQRLAYLYFFSGGIFIASFGKTEAIYSMIAVAVFWLWAEIKNFIAHKNSPQTTAK